MRTVQQSHESIELLMQFFRHNALFLVLVAVAVGVYSIFILPWLRDIGHPGLAVPGYAVFAMLVVYGRANRRRRRLGE